MSWDVFGNVGPGKTWENEYTLTRHMGTRKLSFIKKSTENRLHG